MATASKNTSKTARKTPAAESAPANTPSRPEELKKKQPAATTSVPTAPKPVKAQPAAADAQPKAKAPVKAKPVKEKPRKSKLVRDSFTMPENEYNALGEIKKACVKDGFEVKKSELLRIGVALLKKMPASQLRQALSELAPLKAGRPKKEK